MKTFVAALALLSLSSAAALACTQEEYTAKANDYTTQMQALAQKDPQKATKVAQDIAADAQKPEKQPKTLDEGCAYLQGLIDKIEH